MCRKSVLIFSGYNPRAIVAFCRFARQKNIPFYIIAEDHSDKILKSDYKKNVIAIRNSKKLNRKVIEKYAGQLRFEYGLNEIFVLPSTEYLNRVLLKNQKHFNSLGIKFGLVNKLIYEQISDKDLFCEICSFYGIEVPKELHFMPKEKPFVIKPRKYADDNGRVLKPVIVNNEEDLKKYDSLIRDKSTFLQEFVRGESYYILYYISRDRRSWSVYSQKNLLQQYNGRSIVLAKTASIHHQPIAEKFARLFFDLKFSGLVMVEIKKYEDKFYMIEANPRLWGPSQLILDSGMDLFDRFALENGLIKERDNHLFEKNAWYLWTGGIAEDQKKSLSISDHNFSRDDFFENFSQFCNWDVYRRADTMELYNSECQFNFDESVYVR